MWCKLAEGLEQIEEPAAVPKTFTERTFTHHRSMSVVSGAWAVPVFIGTPVAILGLLSSVRSLCARPVTALVHQSGGRY